MRWNPNFEIVRIADESIVVALGDKADSFSGIVTLNEAAAYLLEHMSDGSTVDELVAILMDEYDVDGGIALHDVTGFVDELLDMGILEQDLC